MENKNYLEELDKLNENQEDVVNDINSNLLTLSSAGTGKTKVIALRTANIIFNGVFPDRILCLTFTNKACNEMKQRIITTLGRDGLKVKVKTFHGFCFDIIKSEAKRNTDISQDFLIFDEEDCNEIIKEILGRVKMDLYMLSNFIYEVKHFSIEIDAKYRNDIEFVTKEFIKLKGDKFFKKFNSKDNGFTERALRKRGYGLVKKYDDMLMERHGLDFSDLVVKVYELFEDNYTLNRWREKFQYIQVDEVQDTSILEYEIIKKLALNKKLSFFGDTNQTIYQWRGSKPFEIIKDFKESFNPVKEIFFDKNYRSTKTLIEVSSEYIEKIRSMYIIEDDLLKHKKIKSYSQTNGDKVSYKCFNTLEEEANFICDKIHKNYRDKLSSIAILTRNNKMNVAYSNVLEKRGIPCFLVEEFKFFRRKEIKDVLAYIKLSLNKYDINSMKRIALNYVSNVGDKTLEYIEKRENKDLGIRLTDFLEESTIELGEPYRRLCDGLTSGEVVVFDVESTGIDITSDEIIQIAAIKINRDGSMVKFEEFIKPKKSVENSYLVHGFSDKYLKENGREAKSVLGEFLEFIKDKIIVGHNIQYDLGILSSELRRLKMNKYNIKGYYDTLDMARKLYPNLENHKLETLSNFIKVEVKPSHNAMDDILATKDILIHMVKKLNETSLERMSIMGLYNKRFKELKFQIDKISSLMEEVRPHVILEKIYELSDIMSIYKSKKELNRIENLKELYEFFKNGDDLSLSSKDSLIRLLTITSLSNSEIDRSFSKENKVPIITIHQAKGLEFDTVFLPALNENIFPSYLSIKENNILEECRLFYVAITRAKNNLYLLRHKHKYGREERMDSESRFISYIPKEYIERN